MANKNLPVSMTFSELKERAVISLPETASLLGVSRTHVYVMANRGEVPILQLGARRVVSVPMLLEMLMCAGASESSSEDLTA